jgi:predicted metal-dependent hydrolase
VQGSGWIISLYWSLWHNVALCAQLEKNKRSVLSEFVIETGQYSYRVQFSAKRRSVVLQVKQGQVTVKAPLGYPLQDVKNIVAAKHAWIMRHIDNYPVQQAPQWLAKRQLPLLDDRLSLSLQKSKNSFVQLDDKHLVVNVSSRVQDKRFDLVAQTLIKNWYKQHAFDWFSKRTAYWQQKMNLTVNDIVIGDWKSRWGYCRQNGELGFNWRLLMAPAAIADYVVVHELSHLKHMNHSPLFWQLVQHYYPEHRCAKHWLRKNHYQLVL